MRSMATLPRTTVLQTLLDFVRQQSANPNLDERGRAVMEELQGRIAREPNVGPDDG